MHLRLYTEEDDEQQENPPLVAPGPLPQEPSQTPLTPEDCELGQYIPLHYHFNMLQDQHRVGAFAEAIKTVVKPGMQVVELGSGTGILSWLAAQQGATVTSIERNPALVQRSRELLEKNLHGDRVTVLQADARDYVPTEPVDLVICEMLHAGLLREKQLEVIQAFKDHYREVFGKDAKLPKFFPEATTLLVQPVQFSYDFAGYQAPLPLFQDPAATESRTAPLAEFSTYANIFYDEPYPKTFGAALDLEITHPGKLTALRFATQNLITILLEKQRGIPWANQFLVLPIKDPVDLAPGDSLHIEFSYQAGANLESLADSLQVSTKTNAIPKRKAA